MCDSIADGGRRCAAHTRGPFEAALTRVNDAASDDKAEARAASIGEVSAHASTRTGAQEVADLITAANDAEDHDQAAWLTTCQRLGESQRDAANAIRRAIQTQRDQATLGSVRPGDVLNLAEEHTYLRTHIRRGTYLRVLGSPEDGFVSVEVLAFRPNDATRARRGPRSSQGAYEARTGQVVAVPVANLRRPASNDDSAAYYRTHTVEYEGTYYTEADANEIVHAEPDSDFHLDANFGPREQPRT